MLDGLTRRQFIEISACAMAAPAIGWPNEAAAAAAPAGGTLVVAAAAGSPRHFNSAVQSGIATGMPAAQIFASPLRFDDQWRPHPYLAERWELAPDGMSLTLHLVKGATFHDGQPITSADVAYSILTIRDNHPFKTMFAPVKQVDTPDPATAVIRLTQPHPALLICMSPPLCPILPKHVFDNGHDIKTNPANLAPIGSGPFKFVEYKPGDHITLEKYDRFFLPGRPKLDRIIYRIISDPSAIVVGLEQGETNFLPFAVSTRDLTRLAKKKTLGVTAQGYQGFGPINWLAFNLLRKPLDDKRVRKAIYHAIDRDFITKKLLLGFAQEATGPIVPSSPFYSAAVDPYAFDLKRANALLDEAGLKPDARGKRFSLTVDYLPIGGPEEQQNIAEYLKPQLKKVGIDVQVRSAPDFPTWAQRISNWDFDMTMDQVFNWGDPVVGVHRTYLTSNIRKGVIWSNTQNYRNPQVDQLLDEAAVTLDEQKRKALYAQFQKIVVDDAPIAWINIVPYNSVYDRRLGNLPTTIWGALSPMDDLYWKESHA